ncbi:hypothetical protein C1646_774089 [Rhizophagus diaphanus]|nr:hypothetical protein C1646_774089 [Rhizophagus diaphanus] [Rhizophagus sp. MUCL 43196]
MNDVAERKIKNKGKQNIKYSEEFTNFLVILEDFSTRALDLFRQNLEGRYYLTNSNLCYENVAKFKRLIDTIKYNGPIATITDNTKLKLCLRYSPQLGCIVGSIYLMIKQNFCKVISNKSKDTADDISILHKKLIQEIASCLQLHILSIRSDGAIVEFQAQEKILTIQTSEQLSICDIA